MNGNVMGLERDNMEKDEMAKMDLGPLLCREVMIYSLIHYRVISDCVFIT